MNKETFINGLNKGAAISIIYCTEPKMNKKNNPFFGRVKKVTSQSGIHCGTSYENSVNNALSRSGSTEHFDSAKPNGKHYISDFIQASNSDESVHYFPLQYTRKQVNEGLVKTKSYYLVDNRLATASEVELIKQFLPTKKPSSKQINHGMNEENEVIYIAPKVCNILAIKQGGAIFDEIGLF